MKIREIIYEAPIPSKALGAIALRGKQWLTAGAEKEAAIARIATGLADDALRSGSEALEKLSKTQVLRQLTATEKDFIRDPKFVSAITKRAASLVTQAKRARVLANVKNLVSNPKIGQLVNAGIVLTPIVEYYNETNKFQEQLEAGQITEAEYEQHRRVEATKVVSTFAAQLAALGVAKKLTGIVRLVAGWIPGVNAVLTTLTPAATKGLMLWLGTDNGQQWLAKVVLSVFPKFVVDEIVTFVGGSITQLIDELKSKLPEFMQIGPSTSQVPTPAQQTQGGKPNAAPTQGSQPSAQQPNDAGQQVGLSIKRGVSTPDRPYNVTIGSD